MTEKKLKISIGIPAYNEEANIGHLLNALLRQKEENFILREIIVVSDGSTDDTEQEVRNINNSLVKLVTHKKRRGKPILINEMFSHFSSDIAIILDADIKITSPLTISRLISPFIDNSLVMHVSGYALPMKPKNWVQKIACAGVVIWNNIRLSKNASDLYRSEGSIRAFSKTMYKEMTFPNASADDTFSYLYCAYKNYDFIFSKEALVYYQLPSTIRDYVKQMRRFLKSTSIHKKYFGNQNIEKYYTVTAKTKFTYLMRGIKNDPLWSLLYLAFLPIPRILNAFSMNKNGNDGVWEVISSTKKFESKFSEKPKIIFSNYDDVKNPYYGGGGAHAIHEVAKRLTEEFDVTVLTGKYPKSRNEVIDRVSYKRIGNSALGPKLGQVAHHGVLFFYVLLNKFDVWIESFTPPISCSFVPLFTRKPVLALVHMLSGQDMYRKYRVPFFLFEYLGVKIYKHFIVLTDRILQKIRKINKHANITLIANGVDIPPKQSIDKKKEYILYIGRIEINQKGLDLLLRAFQLAHKKIDYNLIIAGSGTKSDEHKLAELVRKLGLQDRVNILGRIEKERKIDAFEKAIFGVIPSRFETMGIVALEMISYNVPFITFDIEGFKWIPDTLCLKVKSFDVAELACAMVALTQNEEQRQKMVAYGPAFIANYSWDKKVDDYKRLIWRIIQPI